jgi:2-oxoglutarate ferredoxin oxidoreductase subunit gamma
MLKSHGTEMRGGYVRSQVVLSKEIIDSPMCENPDYFIALSSAAYNRFKDTVADAGLIIYDPTFVEKIDDTLKCTQKEFPAKQLAVDQFNNPLFANTLVLGLIARVVEILDKEIVLESLLSVIPKFHDQNRKAFEIGFEYASQ